MDPRECSSCRSAFCRECIDEWKDKENEKCPTGCSLFEISQPHPLVVKALAKLNIKCENQQSGCEEKVSYGDLPQHLEECEY